MGEARMQTTQEKLKDIHWLAERLSVRTHRAYELIRTGQIPAVRLGRQVRVDPLAVEAFIRSGGTGEEG